MKPALPLSLMVARHPPIPRTRDIKDPKYWPVTVIECLKKLTETGKGLLRLTASELVHSCLAIAVR